MEVYTSKQIMQAFRPERATALIREGLIAYAAGRMQLPPTQHIRFDSVTADCVVKSGYLEGDKVFVVKVWSGFEHNAEQGLESRHGMLLVCSARTGEPQALLLDKGWLTAQRTTLTGRLAAEAMAPSRVTAIGLLGCGQQAQLQLEALASAQPCRQVWVWGRNPQRLQAFCEHFAARGYDMRPTLNARQLAKACQLIVCCTPATQPLLQAEWILPGTHITTVGADRRGRQELAVDLVARADVLAADCASQALEYGEFSHALAAGRICREQVAELGDVLAGRQPGRRGASDITIASLSGFAAQDVQIAKSVLLKEDD